MVKNTEKRPFGRALVRVSAKIEKTPFVARLLDRVRAKYIKKHPF